MRLSQAFLQASEADGFPRVIGYRNDFCRLILPTTASIAQGDEPLRATAVTVNERRVAHIGTPSRELYAELMGWAISESGILLEVRPPEGAEVSTRAVTERT